MPEPREADDVDFVLGKLAERLSTRSVRLARMILIQAIRNAMVNDLVVPNVADLAAVPTGKPGRPSRSLNLEQALAVLDAASAERLWPYVDVSTGESRTEKSRRVFQIPEVAVKARRDLVLKQAAATDGGRGWAATQAGQANSVPLGSQLGRQDPY